MRNGEKKDLVLSNIQLKRQKKNISGLRDFWILADTFQRKWVYLGDLFYR